MDGAHSRPKRWLLGQIVQEHEAELVVDLRKLGIDPSEVDLDELLLIVDVLLRDPTSWLHAAVAKWKHPITHEWSVLVSMWELLAQVNTRKGRKAPRFPKPWPDPNSTSKGKTRRDARGILKRAKDGELDWQNKPMPM
jgi:hypothetical protein